MGIIKQTLNPKIIVASTTSRSSIRFMCFTISKTPKPKFPHIILREKRNVKYKDHNMDEKNVKVHT